MKIAYIGQKGIPMTQGGVEAHVENLAIEMADLGHEVYVYTRPYYTDKNLKKFKGVNLISIPSLQTKNFDAITHTFLCTIHALFQNYDVIHYHSVGASLMSFIPRIFVRAKIIGTFHCIDRFHTKWGAFAKFMLRLGEITICKFPHETIVVSEHIQKYCLEKYNKKTTFIPNGFKIEENDKEDILKKFNIKHKKYFLCVSRLMRHKGIHYLIAAYRKLNSPEYQIVIVGDTFHDDDYKKELMELSSDDKNIIFTGTQMGKNLDELFTNAFAYVLPSEDEGLSISLLEAMAHEIPVITSNIEANQYFIDRGLIYSFENTNSDDLKSKMSEIIEKPKDAMEKAKQTAKYIKENFSWEKIANQVQELYKK